MPNQNQEESDIGLIGAVAPVGRTQNQEQNECDGTFCGMSLIECSKFAAPGSGPVDPEWRGVPWQFLKASFCVCSAWLENIPDCRSYQGLIAPESLIIIL
jgi:hypothetical protein